MFSAKMCQRELTRLHGDILNSRNRVLDIIEGLGNANNFEDIESLEELSETLTSAIDEIMEFTD